ncbi:hypothetical protein B296_00000097 [Ensete ventricosum]|uniref:Uncharacterized protein n=1 Tax=Ensete ventricosum TaxID=4639 RepID=A0A427B2U2_ENSVE|nr:hypothetical protein B296_00000097 [Ensete ventricosum]
MSFASSYSESRSVEISAHRSRVLSRPSGDSISVAVVSSAPGDFGIADALAAMRSFFNVDSSIGQGDAEASTTEKHPSSRAGAGLRKHLQKVAAKQPADASGSTTRTSADKRKGMVELEEVPEQGYTIREPC